MNHLQANGEPKSLFPVVSLGTQFDSLKVQGHIGVIHNILSRPIDGLNIVTTCESEDVQFYGWGSPIKAHKDGTGYIFFMPLSIESPDSLVVGNQELPLEVGTIYALNDSVTHSTKGAGRVVAAFLGSATAEQLKNDPDYLSYVVSKFKAAVL